MAKNARIRSDQGPCAEITCQEGLSRARVTQIMLLLGLAPEIQEHILNLQKTANRSSNSERSLKYITQMENQKEQMTALKGSLEAEI